MNRSHRAALLLSAAMLVACDKPPQAPAWAGQPVQVIVVPDPANLELPAYPGRAEATTEINLSFEVPGRMLERSVTVGDRVTRGDALARLDLRDYQAGLDRAVAVRDRTAAALKRVRQASETGAVSLQDLSEAEAQAESARAAVAIEQKALNDATLRAPFDGVVTATYAEALQEIGEGDPILRLLDMTTIEMWVQVPEDRISRAAREKTVSVQFDALPGRSFSARVAEIATEADDQTRTYPVKLSIDQPDGGGGAKILPGMAGEATAELPAGAALLGPELPLAAIFSDATLGSFVWVIAEDGSTVNRRAVKTGDLTDRGIMIREGLKPGERVVTQGSQFLSEGLKVLAVEQQGNAS